MTGALGLGAGEAGLVAVVAGAVASLLVSIMTGVLVAGSPPVGATAFLFQKKMITKITTKATTIQTKPFCLFMVQIIAHVWPWRGQGL